MRKFCRALAFCFGFILALMTQAVATPFVTLNLTAGAARQAALAASDLARVSDLPAPRDWRLAGERACLALALYHEARGEVRSGQVAVAWVILNRVKSRAYPDSVCGVVFQNAERRNRCQFSFACDGRSDFPDHATSWRQAVRLAKAVICEAGCQPRDLGPDSMLAARFFTATHYHTDYVSPSWSKKLTPVGRIGDHLFFASARVLAKMP